MPELIFPLTYFWGQYQPGDSRPLCCVQWGKVSQSRGLTKRPPPTHTLQFTLFHSHRCQHPSLRCLAPQSTKPFHYSVLLSMVFDLFFIFWGPHSHPSALLDVTFCTAKRTQVFVGPAKFDPNRCNESPLRGEKPDFWPVSKNNTGSLQLVKF